MTLSGNATGHYYYAEASAPRTNGDIATLNSPWYRSEDTQCIFTFFYHMKKPASDTDTKLVIKQQYDSMVTKTVGEFNTSTTDEWEHGAATVSI